MRRSEVKRVAPVADASMIRGLSWLCRIRCNSVNDATGEHDVWSRSARANRCFGGVHVTPAEIERVPARAALSVALAMADNASENESNGAARL